MYKIFIAAFIFVMLLAGCQASTSVTPASTNVQSEVLKIDPPEYKYKVEIYPQTQPSRAYGLGGKISE
jgi:outer membrane murein-binding lipoprotein Lpp